MKQGKSEDQKKETVEKGRSKERKPQKKGEEREGRGKGSKVTTGDLTEEPIKKIKDQAMEGTLF